jgi:hypothetical protein
MLKILLVLAIFPFGLSAETVTLIVNQRPITSPEPVYSQQTITLAEGDLATVLIRSGQIYLDVLIDGTGARVGGEENNCEHLPVIAGPATLRAVNFSNLNGAFATISIKRAGQPIPSTPAQAVVIPDDGSGDRQVRLESSTDLVNWTATQPGIFSSSNTARFFRVRVVKVASE